MKPHPMEYALYAVVGSLCLILPFYLTGLFLELAATAEAIR